MQEDSCETWPVRAGSGAAGTRNAAPGSECHGERYRGASATATDPRSERTAPDGLQNHGVIRMPGARPESRTAARGTIVPAGPPGRPRSTRSYSPTLEPLLRTVRANNPKADLDLIERAYAVAERATRARSARAASRTSPTRWPSPHPRRPRHDRHHRWPPPCCTTPSRTPTTPSTSCAATSATRSPCWSTASPSSTR